MVEQALDLEALQREAAQAAARYLSGRSGRFDLRQVLEQAGSGAFEQLLEDPEQPAVARRLARMAAPLAEATRRLAGAEVEAARGPLPRAEALRELAKTADEQRLRAVARALAEADTAALATPLEEAFEAGREESSEGDQQTEVLSPAQIGDLLAPPPARSLPTYRLVVSCLSPAPLPVSHWRGELRPLIEALLAPGDVSLGITAQRAAHGPAAFCAQHPSRERRLTIFARDGLPMSYSRSFAAATGTALALGCGRPQRSVALATLLAARLAATGFWRCLGLGRDDARDAARLGGQSLLRLLGRIAAYASCEEEEARALAAEAGALLHEYDDLVAALRWRGPYPDAQAAQLRCGRARLIGLLVDVAQGLRLELALRDALGEDWHRVPEAAEQLWELDAAELPALDDALLSLVEI